MPKIAPAKARKSKAKAIKVEVLHPSHPFSEFLDDRVFIMRNQEIEIMKMADLSELAYKIEQSAIDADRKRADTLATASMAVLEAWTCGTILNLAKEQHKHGEFQKWVEDIFTGIELSLRTAQRYMQLAKSCPNARDLITTAPSLRQAYIASGIFPEPLESAMPEEKGGDSSRARAGLLKSVVSVQNKLRRFSKQKIRLDQATKKDLIAAKAEIDKLFKALIA